MFAIEPCRPDEALIGNSPAIRRISGQLKKAALTDVPVLITGEGGTGKDLAARLLHSLSIRRAYNFLKASCSAIPNQLLESELIGHEQNTFAGANRSKVDNWQQAEKGTLFLDEIGELDLPLQAKLLYALQGFEAVRFGALKESLFDIRLICATTRDLEAEVAKGRFRVDLFYRINVVRIQMPSLREYTSDVPILMDHFVSMYSARFGKRPVPLSSSFIRSLASYHWPGNVRELENMAKRYVVMGGEEHVIKTIGQSEGPRLLLPGAIDLITPLRVRTKREIRHLERKIILDVLEAHRWNRRKAARSLDISYRTLLYKIKGIGLPKSSFTETKLSEASFSDSRELLGENIFSKSVSSKAIWK